MSPVPIRNALTGGLFIILALLPAANSGFAQDETAETAERLMNWQLAALKDGDYQRFVEHGNRAFKGTSSLILRASLLLFLPTFL